MLLAFDFDGVLCDGMLEYWQIAWRTYCQVWSKVQALPPVEIAPVFYRLRPVVETGWEMPVLIHAILEGYSEAEILAGWMAIAEKIIVTSKLEPIELSTCLDELRDQWIAQDLTGWLNLHRFYPGIISKLQQLLNDSVPCFIITTKETRFAWQLLQKEGIDFPRDRIFGKEVKQPKHQTLRALSEKYQEDYRNIYFVEDRLKTLISITNQPDLTTVNLYLADWGYNTASERVSVQEYAQIHLLSLDGFAQDISAWS